MGSGFVCWCLCGLFFLVWFGDAGELVGEFALDSGSESSTVSYDRLDEVKKQCGSVLSSAAELRVDDDRVSYGIKQDLSFLNGDWWQDGAEHPLMPFVDRQFADGNMSVRGGNFSDLGKPNKLVSFWITDVDRGRRLKKSVAVNGFLVMGITTGSFGKRRRYEGTYPFQMFPQETRLSIRFQGVYSESKKNPGERVICLLGSTNLPSRESDSADPWAWAKGPHYDQPPLLQDDQILLILRYPASFTLTTRVIRGEMRSLNQKSNLKYFDDVHISSQFGTAVSYDFGSQELISKACDPYPYTDSTLDAGIDLYKGERFCEIFDQVTAYGSTAFKFVPNWRCNGTNDDCSRLGPFATDKEVKASNGSFEGVVLFMQSVRCEQGHMVGNASSAMVSAVFRVEDQSMNHYASSVKSGLNNMTIAAEGIWKSSSGQLCMVGCLGIVDSDRSSCNSRICLYIPFSFSIKQRSILIGSFSSTEKAAAAAYYPLSFEKLARPSEFQNYFWNSTPRYAYSKIEAAGTVLERNEPFSFRTVIKKSLLKFPKLEDADALMISLSNLAEDLTIQSPAYPDPPQGSMLSRCFFEMDIISIGPLFGRYWSVQNTSIGQEEAPYYSKPEYTEKQLLMNVSAQITITGEAYQNVSALFVEGLYDPHFGKMYLIGCRDVRASWSILFESRDLEAGLDCLIDVVVSYPPTTARWLVNPTAKISISSQRSDDDPLHFNSTSLQTLPIMYQRQREDILSHRVVEAILRVLTLSFAIGCISSQLLYINYHLEWVPFMSLVMLGTQALGYSLPLITGAEALFKKTSSESYSYGSSSYDLERNQWFHVIGYMVKLLVLVTFLLTLRLCQKVWKSRTRLLSRAPLEPHCVPSDKHVLLVSLIVHAIGYGIVLITHSAKSSTKPLQTEVFIDKAGSSRRIREWETELEEYVGLVQDFFLLPQIIGNFLWQSDCVPLRKLYFIGITVVRLLPHLYDYIRAPIRNPYFATEYEYANPNMDFYSKFGDVAIPTTAVVFAVVVYIQQRCGYDKLSRILTFGRCRLLPMKSIMYERLPSKSVEAELASVVNRNDTVE